MSKIDEIRPLVVKAGVHIVVFMHRNVFERLNRNSIMKGHFGTKKMQTIVFPRKVKSPKYIRFKVAPFGSADF